MGTTHVHVLGFNQEVTNDPDGALGFLFTHFRTVYNFLLLSDELWSDVLFQDKQIHTISWHIAMRAKAGDFACKLACEALNWLSSDHCAHALAGGV